MLSYIRMAEFNGAHKTHSTKTPMRRERKFRRHLGTGNFLRKAMSAEVLTGGLARLAPCSPVRDPAKVARLHPGITQCFLLLTTGPAPIRPLLPT
jgi:hypothetical protein